MKRKNWKELLKSYSFFGKDFMFECGYGWYDLIAELCEKINRLKLKNFKVVQVKQKLGELKFYYTGRVPLGVDGWIAKAELKSQEICENCGKTGTFFCASGFVITTLCSECRMKKQE